MRIAGIYSFNNGAEIIEARFATELQEIRDCIAAVDSVNHKTKVSKEKTMPGKILYKPGSLNKAFKREFFARGWSSHKIQAEYPTEYYTPDYERPETVRGAFREMDFVKDRVGVEVQFGKYAFMVYNVSAKMTIFHIKEFANEMSTGVSYFEQFVWDLEHRGVSNIDIPVLILGITV